VDDKTDKIYSALGIRKEETDLFQTLHTFKNFYTKRNFDFTKLFSDVAHHRYQQSPARNERYDTLLNQTLSLRSPRPRTEMST
jgi:hypothetical protein